VKSQTENNPSTKIFSDLDYFKEASQKNYDSSIFNQDPLKALKTEFDSTNYQPDRRQILSSFKNPQANSTPVETRQIIEREMEPYIFSIKNELKLMIENFTRELGDYKFIKSELNLVKETVMENKKIILIFQEDIEKKFSDYSQKFFIFNKQFEDVKYNFVDITQKFKNYDKLVSNNEERIIQTENLREKMLLIEKDNKNLLKKLDEEILIRNNQNLNFSNKLKNFETSIDNIKDESIHFNEDLSNVKSNNSYLSNRLEELNRNSQKIYQNESQIHILKEKINSNTDNILNIGSNLENIGARMNNLTEKFQNSENSQNREMNKISDRCIEINRNLSTLKEKVESITDTQNFLKSGLSSLSILENKVKHVDEQMTKTRSDLYNKSEEIENKTLLAANEICEKMIDEKTAEISARLNSSVNVLSKNINEYQSKLDEVIKANVRVKKDEEKDKKEEENTIKNYLGLEITKQIDSALLKERERSEQREKDLIVTVEKNLNSLNQKHTCANFNNEGQSEINKVLQNGLEKVIKQTLNLSNDVNSLKNDGQRFEENFESIEKNFEKLNEKSNGTVNNLAIIDKKQNLINEIIKALTANIEKDKNNFQGQLDSITNVQRESLENTIKIVNGLKSDIEIKFSYVNETTKENINKISLIEDKIKNNSESFSNNPKESRHPSEGMMIASDFEKKFKELSEQNEVYRQKIEKALSKLISITVERELFQTNEKLIETDEKFSKITNYFKSKIEDIEEFINYMNSKYEVNYQPVNNSKISKIMGNQNNVTNHEMQEEASNADHKDLEFLYNILIWPSGVVSNIIACDKFNLKIPQNKILSEKFSDKEIFQMEYEIKSNKNSVDDKFDKKISSVREKWEKNTKYHSTHPMNYHEIKHEMRGYLNKYLIIPKQYENILEFDGEEYHDAIDTNSNKSNKNSFKNKRANYDFQSFGIENNKNDDDLVYFVGNENDFMGGDDDFDKFSI